MPTDLAFLHCHTPTLTVIESRGLAVRSVDYHRAVVEQDAEARVNRRVYDPAGRPIAQWDPRLFLDATAPANISTTHSLSGTVLCTVSVDAGLRLSLFGEAGQPVHAGDGRGSQRWMQYDDQLRLTALFEQPAQGDATCAERLTYAANEPELADHNQCGRLLAHKDVPGTLLFRDYGLTGAVLDQGRQFEHQPTPGFTTHSHFNPLGDLRSRTDAHGNEQRLRQTLDGQLRTVDLRLNDTPEWLPMVSAITYNAHGQVEQEIAGNGVTTSLEYALEDGRLNRLVSRLGQNAPLQDLHYAYDPVGNVTSIEDAALPVRYFANQRIEPVSHYRYDTLYRLIEATGWEAGSVKQGPASALTTDPAMPGHYRQTYAYDAGNNLLELTHVGPQNHGHRMVAAAHSNRCLPVRDGIEPGEDDFRNGFDANGNLRMLQPGQTLNWDLRNQLSEVRPVERDSGDDDYERYEYGADGMRVRKVRSLQTNARTNTHETLYLPGVEIRTHSGTGEVLHVIDVPTGRGSVRVLHWVAEKPEGIANNQQRYSLTDHLGSSAVELDQDGQVITQERYYPFGGTCWSNGEAVQVSYKTGRYSDKERDATGLYYYGFRYYAPWLQRWLSPDPAGSVDGLNLFWFVRNSSLMNVDRLGNITEEAFLRSMEFVHQRGGELVSHGFNSFTMTQAEKYEGVMNLAKEILSGAVSDLKNKRMSEETRSMLVSSFGPKLLEKIKPGSTLVKTIRKNLESISAGIDQIEKENMERILFVKHPEHSSVGGTTLHHPGGSADENALISINVRFVEERHPFVLASTLIHEVAHWKLGAKDYFYQGYPFREERWSADDFMEVLGGLNWNSENALKVGPDEEKMKSSAQKSYQSLFVDRLPGANAQLRSQAYVSDVKVRKNVLLENADFYPSVATRIYYSNRPHLVVNG